MKVRILQENLSKSLSHVVKAVSSRPTIPVLSNVLIEAKKGKLKLSTTNLEIGINSWIGADIEEEGSITVSAKLLFEFVNSLKAGKISLIQDNQKLVVNSVDNNAEFFIIPADDFPAVPQSEKSPSLTVNAQIFAESIVKTVIATASDDSRPVLNGVLFEVEANSLKMVGVDGFRLAKTELVLAEASKENFKEVVPSKSLNELEKIIKDVAKEDDVVEVYLLGEKNQILFKIGDVELTSRLIEGEYPDYNQIIPKEKSSGFSVLKDDIANATKIIMIFARNIIGNKTRFSISPTEKKLRLSTKIIDVGMNDSAVDIVNIEGESFETAYNAKFLLDMLSTMKSDEVIYETNGATAPGVFKDKESPNYIHIVMPMRLD